LGAVNRIAKWFSLDIENLPHELTPPIKAFNPSLQEISSILQDKQVKWIRENGVIYIPETNAQIIVEVEDSRLIAVEWVQKDSLITCKNSNGILSCKCV
jgi:hypothetical protein